MQQSSTPSRKIVIRIAAILALWLAIIALNTVPPSMAIIPSLLFAVTVSLVICLL